MNIIAEIFVILLLTVTTKALPYLAKSRCDITLNLKCYIWVDTAATWQTAEDACVEWGGHLVSIHSDLENYAVRSIRDINGFTWIGLSDTANDGDYVWTDGTPFNYHNFSPGQPDSYYGESCFHLRYQDSGELTWNDYHCNRDSLESTHMSFVCKKDLMLTLKGEPGEPGSNGLNGEPGEPGSNGFNGEQGRDGRDGLRGVNGDKGERGVIGFTGPQGINGPIGQKGRDGYDGPQGANGNKGERGANGDTGERGPVGSYGDPGTKGGKGERGTRGTTGDPGRVGSIGQPGSIGSIGPPGRKGVDGQPGTGGLKGEAGSNGGKGDKGERGDRGKRGFPGVYAQSKGTHEPVGSQDQSD